MLILQPVGMHDLPPYHFDCELREYHDAENLGHRRPGGDGVHRENNHNHNDDRDQIPPDNNNNRNPPMNPLANWQNVLPDDLVEHPVITVFLASNSSFLVSDPRLPGNPIIFASPVSITSTVDTGI